MERFTKHIKQLIILVSVLFQLPIHAQEIDSLPQNLFYSCEDCDFEQLKMNNHFFIALKENWFYVFDNSNVLTKKQKSDNVGIIKRFFMYDDSTIWINMPLKCGIAKINKNNITFDTLWNMGYGSNYYNTYKWHDYWYFFKHNYSNKKEKDWTEDIICIHNDSCIFESYLNNHKNKALQALESSFNVKTIIYVDEKKTKVLCKGSKLVDKFRYKKQDFVYANNNKNLFIYSGIMRLFLIINTYHQLEKQYDIPYMYSEATLQKEGDWLYYYDNFNHKHYFEYKNTKTKKHELYKLNLKTENLEYVLSLKHDIIGISDGYYYYVEQEKQGLFKKMYNVLYQPITPEKQTQEAQKQHIRMLPATIKNTK